MPGIIISRPKAPLLSKLKVALSRTKAPKDTIVVPIPAQAASVDAVSVAEREPCGPAHSLIALPSDIISVETLPTLLATSSTAVTQPEAPVTINDLPPEILAEIFHTYMFCEDESDLLDPELQGMVSVFLPNPHSAPLLFCRVCSYWREVAISTPSLWSAIAIREPFTLETVALWLQRSHSHPLSLFITLFEDASPAILERLPSLLQMLYNQMPRWKKVSVHLPTEEYMQDFLFSLLPAEDVSPAVQLEYLRFSRDYMNDPLDDYKSLVRLSSFPHPMFRRIAWGGEFNVPEFSRLPSTMWTNLHQMCFVTTTTILLHSFLEACPNIRHININVLQSVVYDGEAPHTPIIAHNLWTLNIGTVLGNIMETLDFLLTPNLQRLSFQQDGYRGQSAGFHNFLERSGCKLNCLAMVCISQNFDQAETRRMLESPIITLIPNFSLRIYEKSCAQSFPQTIISEKAGHWMNTAYAHYEAKNYSYHLGWGALDIARRFHYDYPFLVKQNESFSKWSVSLIDGPLTRG
ncbi:hypothetical protein CVT24_012672 [Panaeolus cyanescens]|uniref:Uncharacterized protein n=1 Tax=Panaeolus cyanescens TaxID=181874 RepID=A0A409YKE3_9AGAR|nr:hypothetical protein CVT24_012672 [Panaeolus cyanescens]